MKKVDQGKVPQIALMIMRLPQISVSQMLMKEMLMGSWKQVTQKLLLDLHGPQHHL
jgi:hypothetical protein